MLLLILCVLHLEKDLVPAMKFLPERFYWPQISLSKTMTYAIVFTALFLLEIQALKRLLEKQYRF